MIKKIFIAITFFSMTGCSGMVDKIKNTELTNVSFPAKQTYTINCLDTAATRRDYFLEKGDHIGVVDRYTLRKVGGKPTVTLDVQGMSNSTTITIMYDQRDQNTANDVEGILGYCKKYIG